jgi:predicted GNAT family acetyltransferase
VESSWELDVLNDAEHGRWIATLGAEAIAELPYRFVGGRVVLLSTWVDPVYRNNRVATELVARVLDEIRESGKKITIICPVVGKFAAYMAPSALGAPLGGGFTPSGSPASA